MKWEERMALEYFQSKGFKGIQVEPDGKIPPDLIIEQPNSSRSETTEPNFTKTGKALAIFLLNRI